jgi:cupin 2 domain-containing protein
MHASRRGRLLDGSAAPPRGEHVEKLVQVGGVVIEQILSGAIDQAVEFDQDHDEWVVLLHGTAELEVDGESVHLQAGDWLLLPRRTPHRVIETVPESTWLAVHMPTR